MKLSEFRFECPDSDPRRAKFFIGEEDVTEALGVSAFSFNVSAENDALATIRLTLISADVRATIDLPKLSREALEALAKANGYTVSPIADVEPTP